MSRVQNPLNNTSKMKTAIKIMSLYASALAVASYPLTAAQHQTTLDKIFGQVEESVPGKFGINYRIRYEETNDEGGISHRVRYGYTTENYNGFTASLEGETVDGIKDGFNSLDIAGEGTDLNQLWGKYKNADLGSVKVGRQIYTLEDQRFIGHVGWRQNIQTFDAATLAFTGIENLDVGGFYFDKVNRINGTNIDIDAFGIHAAYSLVNPLKLVGFYYDLDSKETLARWDSETIGIRASGELGFEDLTVIYALSVASQTVLLGENGGYFSAETSSSFAGVKLGIGYDVLEQGFRTPLATVHKFQGFADVFVPQSITGTGNGVEDLYIFAGYNIPVGDGIAAKFIYHSFEPETGTGEFGDEINLVATYELNKNMNVIAKYADYEADGSGSGGFGGTDKELFTFELNFNY